MTKRKFSTQEERLAAHTESQRLYNERRRAQNALKPKTKRTAWNKGLSKYATPEEKKKADYLSSRASLLKPAGQAKAKIWYDTKFKASARASHLKTKYGLTVTEYEDMKFNQLNVCAICFEERFLVVDHCHAKNVVRGLLCDRCNRGLGLFDDNIDILNSAIAYLIGIRGGA